MYAVHIAFDGNRSSSVSNADKGRNETLDSESKNLSHLLLNA